MANEVGPYIAISETTPTSPESWLSDYKASGTLPKGAFWQGALEEIVTNAANWAVHLCWPVSVIGQSTSKSLQVPAFVFGFPPNEPGFLTVARNFELIEMEFVIDARSVVHVDSGCLRARVSNCLSLVRRVALPPKSVYGQYTFPKSIEQLFDAPAIRVCGRLLFPSEECAFAGAMILRDLCGWDP